MTSLVVMMLFAVAPQRVCVEPPIADTSVRTIDFRNMRYPVLSPGPNDYPRFKRLNLSRSAEWRTLTDGRHMQSPAVNSELSEDDVSVTFRGAVFGKVSSDREEDALIALRGSSGGTLSWGFLYLVTLDVRGNVCFLDWFMTGDRANQGLKDFAIADGKIRIELFTPQRRIGDCCTDSFDVTTWSWRRSRLVQIGLVRH